MDGILTNDSISGFDNNGERIAYAVDSIRYLEQCAGTRAGVGFALGALFGLSITAPFTVSEEEKLVQNEFVRYTIHEQVFHPEVILAGTLGGGLMGLMIGGTDLKWKVVTEATSLGQRMGKQPLAYGLSFTWRF